MANKHKKRKSFQDNAPGILTTDAEVLSVKKALDAYTNPSANLGAGANNLAETAGYIMQRMTWDYYTLNILFRNNWIAKAIIEKPANEMMKNGFELQTELDPDKVSKIMNAYAGIVRKEEWLKEGLEKIQQLGAELMLSQDVVMDGSVQMKEFYQEASWRLLIVASLIMNPALLRKESRGGHYREDFPCASEEFAVHSVQQMGKEITTAPVNEGYLNFYLFEIKNINICNTKIL
jgi:L-aspartate oxidase